MNILLLNDNPVVTKLVTLSAQKTGNEILTISNIEDIVDGSYDLLIVDEALYTPTLFDELESKISYKRSLYMLSRGVASVDGFDNEVKKPFLPTDLVELLSTIAINVANVQEKKKEKEIDLNNLDLEDELNLDEVLHSAEKAQEIDEDDLSDLDFDLDSFDLNDLDETSSENDDINSILDQDDVNEVKNLLDETDDDELKMDDLDDNFSFDDLDLEDALIEEKDEPQTKAEEVAELELEDEFEDELEDELDFGDLDLEDEQVIEEKEEIQEELTTDEIEDSMELEEEDFSLDELEDRIETAIGSLSDEDLEQEIDLNVDDLGELSTLDEKSLKIALGEEVEEDLDAIDAFDEDEFEKENIDTLDDVDELQESLNNSITQERDEKTDGVEALKTLLRALSNEDVVASLKGMNVSINISFGNNSDK